MAEANPEAGAPQPVTDRQTAIDAISDRLEPDSGPTQEPESPEANQGAEEAPSTEPTGEPAAEAEEPTSDESQEAEPTEGETLPETIEGLAEALEIPMEDLLGHLQVPITVDGVSQHVTLADAIKGQQFEADYRQKTGQLADERRAFDEARQQAETFWQQRFEALDALDKALAESGFGEPTPEQLQQLLNDEPTEYLRLKEQMEQTRNARDELRQRVEGERQQMTQEREGELVKYRDQQQKRLLSVMPELQEPEKLAKFEGEMTAYLGGLGFQTEEIQAFASGGFDHRQILIIRDAMRAQAMNKAKSSVVKKLKTVPKIQRPGAARTKADGETEKRTANLARLRQATTRTAQREAGTEFIKGLLGDS